MRVKKSCKTREYPVHWISRSKAHPESRVVGVVREEVTNVNWKLLRDTHIVRSVKILRDLVLLFRYGSTLIFSSNCAQTSLASLYGAS